VTVRQSPTVRRRRLVTELRRLREAAGLTIDQVAEALECSDSKISRIETGHVGATPRDVRDMLMLYGVTGTEQDELIQIAREARQKAWWHAYSDVPPTPYVGFEAAASAIHYYGASLVPGLLQTEEYARAVLRAVRPRLGFSEVERRVRLRMDRQAILIQDSPPSVSVILDEAAVRRLVGGPEAMLRQIHRIIAATAQPSVEVQILPFTAGQHAAMDGGFTHFHLAEAADPDRVFFETPTGIEIYTDDPGEVDSCVANFESLRNASLKPDSSISFLTRLTKEL
jgi:transcriptional regulator with XRE-family HTH domain